MDGLNLSIAYYFVTILVIYKSFDNWDAYIFSVYLHIIQGSSKTIPISAALSQPAVLQASVETNPKVSIHVKQEIQSSAQNKWKMYFMIQNRFLLHLSCVCAFLNSIKLFSPYWWYMLCIV